MLRLRSKLWIILLVSVLSLAPNRSLRSDVPGGGGPALSPTDTTNCRLCAGDLDVPVVSLAPAELDSLARAFAELNQARIARLDSLFLAGEFGSPDSRSARRTARRTAHLAARIACLNAYRFLFRYATDTCRVYEFNESTFAEIFRRYSDPGLFCIARLERGRIGLGRVCIRYNLDQYLESETIMGGKRMKFRVKDAEVGDNRLRMLSLDLPTGSANIVEVLLAEHYTCEVEYARSEGPPTPYELFLVKNIHGGWLRKWGMHHPTAFMFWVTPQIPEPSLTISSPSELLVGVRIYIPHLKLGLPLLPDINLDDLRNIELPQPILKMEYLHEERHPDWLETDDSFGFTDWKGSGEVPPDVRRRFPDD